MTTPACQFLMGLLVVFTSPNVVCAQDKQLSKPEAVRLLREAEDRVKDKGMAYGFSLDTRGDNRVDGYLVWEPATGRHKLQANTILPSVAAPQLYVFASACAIGAAFCRCWISVWVVAIAKSRRLWLLIVEVLRVVFDAVLVEHQSQLFPE
ncbi:MAG: hypothetical protein AB8G99_10830 [Planctomycetaceae bacterium]